MRWERALLSVVSIKSDTVCQLKSELSHVDDLHSFKKPCVASGSYSGPCISLGLLKPPSSIHSVVK